MARRSHRAALARTPTDEARLAKLREPARAFVEARRKTRDQIARAWLDALVHAGPGAMRTIGVAAARAHESAANVEAGLRAAVEAIVREGPASRASLRNEREPHALPTALAADYVIARELRSEAALREDGTVEPRPIQWSVVEATIDAVLASPEDVFTRYCESVREGAALQAAQHEATTRFVELLPFLDLDLQRSVPRVAPFLVQTELTERELVDHVLDRLRVRGVRPESVVREPYRLLLAWLRQTALRRALDAYRARRIAGDPRALERLEAEDERSAVHVLDVSEGERGASWWLTRLEEELTPKLRETLRVWRARESISSIELAVELGLVAADRIAAAEAGNRTAQQELKRVCNQIDTRRKRIREHARRLVEDDERRAG